MGHAEQPIGAAICDIGDLGRGSQPTLSAQIAKLEDELGFSYLSAGPAPPRRPSTAAR